MREMRGVVMGLCAGIMIVMGYLGGAEAQGNRSRGRTVQRTTQKVAPTPAPPVIDSTLRLSFIPPSEYRLLSPTPAIPYAYVHADRELIFPPKMSLSVRPSSEKNLPPDQGNQLASWLRKILPGYRTTEKGRFLLNGREAVTVIGEYPAPASAKLSNETLKNCVIVTLYQGRLLTFTFTSWKPEFDQNLPTFTRWVTSIQWLDSTGLSN